MICTCTRLIVGVAGLVGILAGCSVASAQQEAGQWAFDPSAKDQFSADAMLDLRSLNEKVAGHDGFVTISKDGQFLLGSGKEVRFWAVNTSAYNKHPLLPAPDLARHA